MRALDSAVATQSPEKECMNMECLSFSGVRNAVMHGYRSRIIMSPEFTPPFGVLLQISAFSFLKSRLGIRHRIYSVVYYLAAAQMFLEKFQELSQEQLI
jgi:hypothetical protein